MTDRGETIVTEVTDSFTSDVTIEFLKALQVEFGEHLHVVLDNATYFTSKQVQEFIEDSAIEVSYLPMESPDMNAVEECWRQFKHRLGNRFFGSLGELRPAIWAAFDSIAVPDLCDYLCP